MATPEIGGGLTAQRRLILNQLLFKQHAGFKGVEIEHALTETVNGEDRRLIHLTFSRQQQRRSVGGVRDLLQQRRQHRIAAAAAHAGQPQLMNILSYAPAQLGGRRFGKGDDQNLFYRKRSMKGMTLPKAEQQPQIEYADSKGFAGSRGRLDKPLPLERQR